MRLAALAIMLGLALVPATATAAARGREADVVHQMPGVGSGAGLMYNGGPVLHANITHVIFWRPQGSHLTFDRGYMAVVNRFLHNVAAASHRTDNVFGLSGQYTDATHRPAAYASRWAGAVIDTDRLPKNGCVEPPLTGPGWTVCMTDSQLQTEIDRIVRARHLPTRFRDVYFLVTPRGLGSCMDASSTSCALGGSLSGYCGYHSVTGGGLHYAVIPYNAVRGHCQSTNPRPNSSTADPALSTISHELSEVITDPKPGSGWIDSSGEENGDLCITTFGRAIGGKGPRRYNERIHGGRYYLQEEWSNADGGCKPRAKPDHVSFAVTQKTGLSRSFRGTGRDPDGRIVGYRWSFGEGSTGSGRTITHAFPKTGSYRVTLRIADSWDNWAFYTRAVGVR